MNLTVFLLIAMAILEISQLSKQFNKDWIITIKKMAKRITIKKISGGGTVQSSAGNYFIN